MGRNETRDAAGVTRLLANCLEGGPGADAIATALAQARWARAAGDPIARHTAVVAVDRAGVVTIGAPSEAWKFRLERQRHDLTAAFGSLPGGGRVCALRFRVVPADVLRSRVPSRRGPRTARRAAARPTPLAACPPLGAREREALDALGDGDDELRALFASWMRHSRRRGSGG